MRFKVKIMRPRSAMPRATDDPDDADQTLCAFHVPAENDRPLRDVWDKALDRYHHAYEQRVVKGASFARMHTEDGADVILEDTVQELFSPGGPYEEKVLVIEQKLGNEKEADRDNVESTAIDRTHRSNEDEDRHELDADGFAIPPPRKRQRMGRADSAKANQLQVETTMPDAALDGTPHAAQHVQTAPPTPDSHDHHTPISALHSRNTSTEGSSSFVRRRLPGFLFRTSVQSKSTDRDALPSPLSMLSANMESAPKGKGWTIQEDRAFLQGMRDGLDVPRILERYGIDRSESAARSHRIILRKKYPKLRMYGRDDDVSQSSVWIGDDDQSSIQTPCGSRMSTDKASSLTPQSGTTNKANRQIWHRDDLTALHKALSEGLDVTEIQAQLFPNRTHGAIMHKLKRIEDVALERARKGDDWPVDNIEKFGWEDRMFFMLRRAYREGISAAEARKRWGFASGLVIEEVQTILDAYGKQMRSKKALPSTAGQFHDPVQNRGFSDEISEPDTTPARLSFGLPSLFKGQRRSISAYFQPMSSKAPVPSSPKVVITKREQLEALAELKACANESKAASEERFEDEENAGISPFRSRAASDASIAQDLDTSAIQNQPEMSPASVRQNEEVLSKETVNEDIPSSPPYISPPSHLPAALQSRNATASSAHDRSPDQGAASSSLSTPRPTSSDSYDARPGIQLTQELELHIASSALSEIARPTSPVVSPYLEPAVLIDLPRTPQVAEEEEEAEGEEGEGEEEELSSPLISESSQDTNESLDGVEPAQPPVQKQTDQDMVEPEQTQSKRPQSRSCMAVSESDLSANLRRADYVRPSVFEFKHDYIRSLPLSEPSKPAPDTWTNTTEWILSEFNSSPGNNPARVANQQVNPEHSDSRSQWLQDISRPSNSNVQHGECCDADHEASQPTRLDTASEPTQIPESPPLPPQISQPSGDLMQYGDVHYPNLTQHPESTNEADSQDQHSSEIKSSHSHQITSGQDSTQSGGIAVENSAVDEVDEADEMDVDHDEIPTAKEHVEIEVAVPLDAVVSGTNPVDCVGDDSSVAHRQSRTPPGLARQHVDDSEDECAEPDEQEDMDLGQDIRPPWPSSGQLPKSPTPVVDLHQHVRSANRSKKGKNKKNRRKSKAEFRAMKAFAGEDDSSFIEQNTEHVDRSEPQEEVDAQPQRKSHKKKRKRRHNPLGSSIQGDAESRVVASSLASSQSPAATSSPLMRRTILSQSRLSTNDFARMMHIP